MKPTETVKYWTRCRWVPVLTSRYRYQFTRERYLQVRVCAFLSAPVSKGGLWWWFCCTGAGDDTRAWGPPFVGTESAYFLSVNRNKKVSVRTSGHISSGEPSWWIWYVFPPFFPSSHWFHDTTLLSESYRQKDPSLWRQQSHYPSHSRHQMCLYYQSFPSAWE